MPVSTKPSSKQRAFVWRAGVAFSGAQVTCDGLGAAEDLVFLSAADALGTRALGQLVRRGRRRVITSAETLALLGPRAELLARRALVSEYGRPFHIGTLRLELLRTARAPGAAALLVELGRRRVLYAGRIASAEEADLDIRQAEAVCIDASNVDVVGVSRRRGRVGMPAVLRYLAEVRAREVAVVHGNAERVVDLLVAEGHRAYVLTAPRQMLLLDS
jgi:hypothetical protein